MPATRDIDPEYGDDEWFLRFVHSTRTERLRWECSRRLFIYAALVGDYAGQAGDAAMALIGLVAQYVAPNHLLDEGIVNAFTLDGKTTTEDTDTDND